MADADLTLSSASDDDVDQGHRHKRTAHYPREKDPQHLVELLSRAATEIRAEREKVAMLEKTVADLRRSKKQSAPPPPAPGAASARAKDELIAKLQEKLVELATENHLAIEQVALLRLKVVELESRSGRSTTPQNARSHVVTPRTVTPRSNSAPRTQTHFDPADSATRKIAIAGTPQSAIRNRELVEEQRNYNEMMLSRMRRALAPPPTKEQLGEVVHAMVHELQRTLLDRTRAKLPLVRIAPCVYVCGKSKLHLAVDSGRLVVKRGGGHVDLLEHIERNKLCVRAEPGE